jgi:uncharacterized protein YecT (DUF1311 family)
MNKYSGALWLIVLFGYTGIAIAFCDNLPQTQENICLAEEAKVADKKLNVAYRAALATSDKQRQELLRKAQRAWISFRDANCDIYYDMTRAKDNPLMGSMAPQLESECKIRMTNERTAEISHIEPME